MKYQFNSISILERKKASPSITKRLTHWQKVTAKKKEITKDVSAMANSAGGIIIYGVGEYQQADSSYLPEKIERLTRHNSLESGLSR